MYEKIKTLTHNVTYNASRILIFSSSYYEVKYVIMTKVPDDKNPSHGFFSYNTLFFLNQVIVFPALLLWFSGSLRSPCDSKLNRGDSREVLIGISESGQKFSRYFFMV